MPLLARPADLVDIDDANRPAGLDPYLAFGRRTDTGLVEVFRPRRRSSRARSTDRGLEIAWLESKVDAFFIHVQGAARLEMTDGSTQRVTYAAKSGQRFTGTGKVLADLGEIPLRTGDDAVDPRLVRRQSASASTRFSGRTAPTSSSARRRSTTRRSGPIAAAKVPLTPGRSMAVDRLLHTFGTPFLYRRAVADGLRRRSRSGG